MGDLTVGEITSIVSVILVGIGVYFTLRQSKKNALTEIKNEGVEEGIVKSFMDATQKQFKELNENFSRLNDQFYYFSGTTAIRVE